MLLGKFVIKNLSIIIIRKVYKGTLKNDNKKLVAIKQINIEVAKLNNNINVFFSLIFN